MVRYIDLTNRTLLIVSNSTEDYLLLFDGHSLKLNLGGKLLDERLDIEIEKVQKKIVNTRTTKGLQERVDKMQSLYFYLMNLTHLQAMRDKSYSSIYRCICDCFM